MVREIVLGNGRETGARRVCFFDDEYDDDDEYAVRCLTQLNMRQSKVARSFEAQRRNGYVDERENEAVAEREAAEDQRRGPRDLSNETTRSNQRFNVRLLHT